MSALPILNVLKDGETIKSQPIEDEILVGRGDSCIVKLDDRAVSRLHASFRVVDDGVRVEKKSEFAPLKVNGAESTGTVVREGDVVEIGPYLIRVAFPKSATVETSAPVTSAGGSELEKEAAKIVGDMLNLESAVSAEPSPVEKIEGISPVEVDMTGALGSFAKGESEPETPKLDGDVALAVDDNLPFDPAPDAGLNLDFATSAVSSVSTPVKEGSQSAGQSGGSPNEFGAGSTNMMLDMPEDAASSGAVDAIDPAPTDDDGKTKILSSDLVAQLVIENGSANVEAIDLDKEEILIGRGKECEVVINDKKASRKNTVIVRDGNHYLVRDLGSSNGTFVNGEKIKERRLEADDKIDVGDVRFRFVAKSSLYAEKEKDFAPVPTLSDVPMPSDHSVEFGSADAGFASPLAADESGAASLPNQLPDHLLNPGAQGPVSMETLNSPEQTGFTGETAKPKNAFQAAYIKYIRNFKDLKPAQKILVVLVAFLFGMWYIEEDPVPAPQSKQVAQQPANGGVKTFESLTQEQRQFVQTQYDLAFGHYQKQNFDQAIYEVTKIYKFLPDYEKAKELERYANEGKRRFAAKEEERKKKEEEARLHARVLELVEVARGFMTAKQFAQAEEQFSEILSIDPENEQVTSWKQEIEAFNEEKKRIEQEKAVQVAINQRAWDTFKDGQAKYKKSQYRAAIQTLEGVFELGSDDAKVIAKSKAMIRDAKNAIRDIRDPILARAKEKENDGELALAFKLYEKVTNIDPDHPDAYMGMERIRGTLQERAKIMYTEAVVAESYSDFDTAYNKFNSIMKTAPEGSLYYERAQRKLVGYFHYHPKGGEQAAASEQESDAADRSPSSEEASEEKSPEGENP